MLDRDALALLDLGGDRLELRAHLLELRRRRDEQDDDLHVGVAALALDPAGGLEDRAHLHRVQARLHDAQADAAQAEHGVGLVQVVHLLQHALLLAHVLAALPPERHLDRERHLVGQELV